MVQMVPRVQPGSGVEYEPQPRSALLRMKLAVPRPPSDVVLRPRLMALLDAGTCRTLTLLAAPAGFGKTTLLCEWLVQKALGARHQAEPPEAAVSHGRAASGDLLPLVAQPFAAVWLALDAADNDPVRFWDYVLAALAGLHPALEAALDTLHPTLHPDALDALLGELLSALVALPSHAVLVLDDYHVITTPAIHAALVFFLEHLPPQLHVIIASRTDPPLALARLRVRSRLAELRAADLRFSSAETARFLQSTAGLQLSEADSAALADRTEGWVAGLRLAALALQAHADPSGLVAAFTGSHRHVVDYLVDEVLQQQAPAVQSFLLQTSVLERFCGPLCDAVVDWTMLPSDPDDPAPNSQLMLERLDRANLFLVPLDEERGWYRYQHLFAEFLSDRLGRLAPDQLPALHHRAATWFASQGLEVPATQHALAGGDWEQAAELIVRAARTALSTSGEWSTVLRWCAALPPELISRRVDLCLTHAWALVYANEHLAARRRLEEAEALLAADPDAGAHAGLAAIEATSAMRSGNCARALELSEAVLQHMPAAEPYWQGVAALNLGIVTQMDGNLDAARDAFETAAALSAAAGNTRTTLVALHNLADVQALSGRLTAAAATLEHALQRATAADGALPSPIAGMLFVARADLLRERNELAAATRSVEDGIAAGLRGGEEQVILAGKLVLAQIQQASGRLGDGIETIEGAVAQARHSKIARWEIAQLVRATQARLWVAQGRLQLASNWAHTRNLEPQPAAESLVMHWYEYATLVHVRAAQGRFAVAAELAAQLRRALLEQRHEAAAIELLALEAVVLLLGGRTAAALDTLQLAVVRAAPEGYIRTFADRGAPMLQLLRELERRGVEPAYVGTLIAALRASSHERAGAANTMPPTGFPAAGLTAAPALGAARLVEPLSERELQVLRLMAEGLSNEAIAERLMVAVSTVKWYNKHIFAKLEVHSRTQAIARAQSHGLLTRP